jgi:hypothetical protein
MVRGLAAGGKWIRTISTRKRTDFCRLHNGPRSRNGSTSFATGDRQVHGNHAARPPLAHREPPQTRYCNPLRGARGQQGEAAAGFGSGVKRLLADAMLDNTKKGDARCPFPLGYRSRLEYTPRAHFNGVNSKRVYDV